MNEQRRHFSRVPFDAQTHVEQGGNRWAVELIDISLNGLLFKQPEDWSINPGQPLKVNIELSGDVHICMDVNLVHTTAQSAGCRCAHIDLDSITQLKRLMELNIGADMHNRELTALIEAHEEEL